MSDGFFRRPVPPSPRVVSQGEQEMALLSSALHYELNREKEKVKATIEAMVLNIIDAIVNKQPVLLERPRSITNVRDKVKVERNPELSTKMIFGTRSTRTFAMQMYCMSLVYRMVQQEQTSTVRDLYYENMNFFGNQNRLSNAMSDLSLLLKAPREALCIQVSAKGLVAGEISFTTSTGDLIRAKDNPHGIIVPNNLSDLTISTNAQFVLFVEKDATFQRLLDEKVFETLGPIILITGKGYPDVQTRRLLCILNKVYNLKVYALVDCDPHGIEIASVVKWGSFKYSNENHFKSNNHLLSRDIAIPDLIWLGLLPSEVATLSLPLSASVYLTERDKRKLESVAERINFQKLEPWLQEVRVLQQLGMKTELEALFSNPRFTSAVYLPSKLLGVCSPNSNANRSSIGSVVDRSHSQPLFPIANNFL